VLDTSVKAGGKLSETSVNIQRTTWRYIPEDRRFTKKLVCCVSLKRVNLLRCNSPPHEKLLSRMQGSVTDKYGFWIGCFVLLAFVLQLQSTTRAHNELQSKTRSISYWTTSVFSSTVTNDERRIIATLTNELNQLPGEPNMSPCLTVHLLACLLAYPAVAQQ
jgi:hypothetical protein